MKLNFVKMQGAGNDYVYVDCFKQKVKSPSKLSKFVSDRHFGIGSDGLILLLPSKKADIRMQMFNADGSEGAMCGNGIRCLAKLAYESKIVRKASFSVETKAGLRKVALKISKGKVTSVTVDMGAASYGKDQEIEISGKKFAYTPVSMGNPHVVIFVDKITDELVLGVGPQIEKNSKFPGGTNVEFVTIQNERAALMRVWERGSGETLACGTGACAAAVAGMLKAELLKKATIKVPGGTLEIEWKENGHVYLTGPAAEVFRGTLEF